MPALLDRTVTSTEFQNKAGLYLDRAATGPVVITRHKRPSRVLVDFEEFQRLERLAKERPSRTATPVEDLGADVLEALKAADFDHLDQDLNKLMR